MVRQDLPLLDARVRGMLDDINGAGGAV